MYIIMYIIYIFYYLLLSLYFFIYIFIEYKNMNIDDESFACSSSNYDSVDSNNSSLSDSDTLVDKLSNIFLKTHLVRFP